MLKTVENKAEGTQAEITAHEKGFAVGLRDTDSGIKLPNVRIFPMYSDAVEHAYKIANVEMPFEEEIQAILGNWNDEERMAEIHAEARMEEEREAAIARGR